MCGGVDRVLGFLLATLLHPKNGLKRGIYSQGPKFISEAFTSHLSLHTATIGSVPMTDVSSVITLGQVA